VVNTKRKNESLLMECYASLALGGVNSDSRTIRHLIPGNRKNLPVFYWNGVPDTPGITCRIKNGIGCRFKMEYAITAVLKLSCTVLRGI